jgi:serine/threonine-protein kinase
MLPVVGTLFAALVARRNWKQGRTDRNGAFRIAAARFLLALVAWAGLVHPVPTESMLQFFEAAAADLLASSVVLWLVYLAIEPAVRARYPHSIVTWNRLLTGRWLDPQVAADVLIGAAVGCVLWTGAQFLTEIGSHDVVNSGGNFLYVLGTRQWIGRNAGALANSLNVGLVVFAVICLLRRLVGNDILAALATAVLFTLTEGDVARSTDWGIMAALFVAVYSILALVLMRIGLVATISAVFFINAFNGIWLGADWKAWYAPAGIATILLLLSIAALAFWKSLGGRDLLGAEDPIS